MTRRRKAEVCTILHICAIFIFPWGKNLNSVRNLETYLNLWEIQKKFPNPWASRLIRETWQLCQKKLELYNKYKNDRNLLSTLIKQSKDKYFNKYFKDNWNNTKNTWKGIKNIITFNLMFLLVFLIMMLLLVILLTPSTIISVQLPKKQKITSITLINIILII